MKVASWLRVLACPVCRGTLKPEPDLLSCTGCGGQYPVRDGIVHLVRATEVERLDAMAGEYRRMRFADGWRPMTPKQRLRLPDAAPPGYDSLYWQTRGQSFQRLKLTLPVIDPERDSYIAADIGAGTGWLAYRLTGCGYRTAAVDSSIDEVFGLGGCAIYTKQCNGRLIAVRGDLAHLPFQRSSLHLIVFNASLHYAQDIHATLRQVRQLMAPDGLLVVMDTPVSRKPKQGRRLGSRHLARSELEHALESSGLSSRWISVPRGLSWWLHQIRSVVRGKQLFTLPLVVASCKDEPALTRP